MAIEEIQVNDILANLQEFDVIKVNLEEEVLKLSIRIKTGADIETYEKIIKNRFPKYKVQIIFFTQKNEGKTFKKIIGISSGKGGVGKSIVSLNLAFCLRDLGYKVSILDADVYSPSIPGMLDVINHPPVSIDGSTIEPIKKMGIELLSMGLFLQDNQSPIWQESTLDGAFRQFLVQGNWTGDYLIIDFAGGMSCLYNTCMQLIPNIEIVLIGVPNRMIYRDVLRMYAILKSTGMNVRGIIDNMTDSFYDASKFAQSGFNLHGLEKIAVIPYFKEYLNLIENGYPENHKLTYDFDVFKHIVELLI